MKSLRIWLASKILGRHGKIIEPGISIWKGLPPQPSTTTTVSVTDEGRYAFFPEATSTWTNFDQ